MFSYNYRVKMTGNTKGHQNMIDSGLFSWEHCHIWLKSEILELIYPVWWKNVYYQEPTHKFILKSDSARTIRPNLCVLDNTGHLPPNYSKIRIWTWSL